MMSLAGAAAALTAGCGEATATTTPRAMLFYTDVGAGKNVMMLHGWTCDSHDWSWQLPVLETRYRVVAVDLRGHGSSQIMPAGTYSPDDYLADVEELITTRFSGQKFVLMGHSMGGQIAARLAAKRPDLVSAVVSVDGSLGFSAALTPVFQQATDDLQSKNPADVGPPLFEAFYDVATPEPFKRWHARRLQGLSQTTALPAVRESFGPLFLGPNQVGVGKQSEAFCKTITVPFYHLCRMPDQATTMSTWFSHTKSRVELWTGAGHWIQQDRPADVNAAVTAWIDAL